MDVFGLKLDIPLCFRFHSNLILGSLVWYSVFGVHRVTSVSEMVGFNKTLLLETGRKVVFANGPA